MKIVQINATCGVGSTGKIAVAISELLNGKKMENYIFYSEGKSDYKNGIKYTNLVYTKIQALISRVLGNYGFEGTFATRKLIKKLKGINPDIIHIHNIHSHACNLELLFKFIKKNNIKTYWTFHDCWAFTGYCPYFDMADCENWKSECKTCIQRKSFSWLFDRSNKNQKRKQEAILGADLTIITPSEWLGNLVKQSFLKDFPLKVINNGIDLNIFKPTESDFREKYGLKDKFIILGVAFCWDKRKGLDVFLELSRKLDSSFQIVLVGTDESCQLPQNIISIQKTESQKELAEIYTVADVFVNPTREENYPTVNMEAIACGTPVITFNTGGSAEMLDENCGRVVPKNDINALITEINNMLNSQMLSSDIAKSSNKFDKNEKFKEYVDLYTES